MCSGGLGVAVSLGTLVEHARGGVGEARTGPAGGVRGWWAWGEAGSSAGGAPVPTTLGHAAAGGAGLDRRIAPFPHSKI